MSATSQLIHALAQGRPVERYSPAELITIATRHHGSEAEAADILSVSTTTFQSWKHKAPKGTMLEKLQVMVRDARLPKGLTDRSITIASIDHHGLPCQVTADRLKILPGTMDAIIDAYILGDYNDAVDALIDGIGDAWYHRQYRIGVHRERSGLQAGGTR